MRANMSATGTLVIIPESSVEAYALEKWARENLRGESHIIVDLSAYPSIFLGHLSDCSTHNEPAYPAGQCDCGAPALLTLT